MKIANKIRISCLGILVAAPLLAGCTQAEHKHVYGAPVWNWSADYSASAVFSCSNCSEGKETVNATVTHSVTQQATCTQEEKTTYVANVTFNEKEYSDSKVVVTGSVVDHTFGDWSKKDDEQHQRSCACGEVEVENHIWDSGEVTTPATHLTEGVMTYHCTKCDATKTGVISKTAEHTYGEWSKKDDSTHQRVCACGDVDVKNHTWDEGEVTTPATHLTEGVMTYHCTKCDATKTDVIGKTGEHSYGEWSKKDDDTHQKSCACGDIVVENHTWGIGEIVTPATHLTEGLAKYTCTACGATKTDIIEKTSEHNYGAWSAKDDEQHQRTCACGDVDVADHVWDEGEVITPASYSAPGSAKYTCEVCGHEVIKEIPQLLHELSRELTGMSSEAWRALSVDSATEWGNPVENPDTYGLRNDLDAMKKWSWFTKAGKQDISDKVNTQFIAWAGTPDEINDGVAEQVFANKFTVAKDQLVFRAGTDSNSNMINIRINVIAEDGTVTSITPIDTEGNYTALSNSWGQIQQEQWVYGVKLTYDVSDYVGDVVTIAIEVDQPAEGNPTIWLDQIGNYDPSLSRPITGFGYKEYSELVLDASSEWGNPVEDVNTYGLRNNLDAMKKWSWYTKAGKQDISGISSTQFIAWAASADEINDGVAEQVFANKVTVNKANFIFRAGVDTDSNIINVRFNVVKDDLVVNTISPVSATGYVAGTNGWGTINVSQWVFGAKLMFDMTAYAGETVAIVIEVDQPAEGNPTIWLNQIGFYHDEASHSFGNWSKKDDTYHERACACGEVEIAEHTWNDGVVTKDPTHLEEGTKLYTCTVCSATKEESISKLTEHTYGDWSAKDDEQHQRTCACGDVDVADHVWDEGEVITPASYSAPGSAKYTCEVCGHEVIKEIPQLLHELSRELTGMSSEAWRALSLDSATEWGNPVENPDTYGLRNDLDAMKKWSWFTKAGKQDISGISSTQFIAWAASPDEINDGVAEQVFANKFTVAKDQLVFRAGTDSNSNMINIRMNVIAEDGTVTSITPIDTEGNYTALANSWGQIQQEQWVYGVKLTYDVSDYVGDVVTIAIEVDQPAEGNPTIWLNQIGNYNPSLSRAITGFGYEEYSELVTDTATEWGDPIEDASTYGLRNNLDAMKKWSWYTKAGKQDISGISSTQFIAWAASADEINDGVAEQVFANKVTVTKPEFILRAGVDNVGNSINVRVNVISDDLQVNTVVPFASTGYTSGANGWGTITESQWVFGSKLMFDLTDYIGETVAIVIEVDQPADGNPTIWFNQMGLYDFELSRSITGFTKTDYAALSLDTLSEWGDPVENPDTYGLRNNLDAMKKWSWYTKAGKQDTSGISSTQFIAWAASPDEINDGVAEQVFANRVNVSQSNFVLRAGVDNAGNSINVRLNVIRDNLVVDTLTPSSSTGYTAGTNGWGTITESQWVYGSKLVFDMSAYLNEEVVILIEVDQPADGNPTIWFDQMGFYAA